MVNTENLINQNRYLTQEVQRQTQEVQRRIDQMTALNLVAATVSQSLDLDKTLDTALSTVINVCNAEAGGISLIDEATGDVVLRAQQGWENDFLSPPMRIKLGRGLSGEVVQRDEVLVINDLHDTENLAVPRFREAEAFRCIAMAPMHARSKIIGILSIMSTSTNAFDVPTIDVLRAVADTVGVALDNARLYRDSVENESRLSAILQSTADGIITTDHAGHIRLVNNSAERLLGIEAHQIVNQQLYQADIPRELRDPLRIAVSSRKESPEKSFQVKMPDGRILLVFISPVAEADTPLITTDQSQTTDGWVIVLQDVTHLRKAEEMRVEFIQAAAHDMRNPLGVTMTSLGTLQSLATDALAQEVIEIALSGVNRMQRLIDDLLNLERIENGYVFKMEETDITPLLHEACAQMLPLIKEKGHTCHLDVQDQLPPIYADSHWISRSLTNYLSNATKYTPAAGSIRVLAFVNQHHVHLEVIDDGPGIPLDVQSRLFEKFYRVKDASGERGSGLGLAIVKSVIEAHGGRVYMRSRIGEGSTFGMALPVPDSP